MPNGHCNTTSALGFCLFVLFVLCLGVTKSHRFAPPLEQHEWIKYTSFETNSKRRARNLQKFKSNGDRVSLFVRPQFPNCGSLNSIIDHSSVSALTSFSRNLVHSETLKSILATSRIHQVRKLRVPSNGYKLPVGLTIVELAWRAWRIDALVRIKNAPVRKKRTKFFPDQWLFRGEQKQRPCVIEIRIYKSVVTSHLTRTHHCSFSYNGMVAERCCHAGVTYSRWYAAQLPSTWVRDHFFNHQSPVCTSETFFSNAGITPTSSSPCSCPSNGSRAWRPSRSAISIPTYMTSLLWIIPSTFRRVESSTLLRSCVGCWGAAWSTFYNS